MRRSSHLLLFLLLVLASARSNAAAQNSPAPNACQQHSREENSRVPTPYLSDWEAFRARYQFHIQTIAVSRLHEDSSRTLVISEPPPHATLDGLLQVAPVLKNAHVMTHCIGHDGWVKDILFELPSLSEQELNTLSIQLNRYLFFTAYKTTVLLISPAPAPVAPKAAVLKPAAPKLPLDLKVSAAQLRSWTNGRIGTFTPLLGGAPRSLSEILHGKLSGVFLSSSPGLVAWSFPSNEELSGHRVEAREFALDSDLILGAISDGAMAAVIARERIVPSNVMPPLRVETIMLLASAKTGELAQSYERTNFAAGKFREADNADWAPIYLSDQLIDTEYGSLLNITDQLLKSWSLNGTVTYENFPYPRPDDWPFSKPLIELLDVPELTFNWNTTGNGYSAESSQFTTLALNRTGALPVSYIPEGRGAYPRLDKIVAGKEAAAYRYFAQNNDPNLVRVVQYAALYQIFRRFNVTAAPPPMVKAPSEESLINEVTAKLNAFSELTEDQAIKDLDDLEAKQEITPAEVMDLLLTFKHFPELKEVLQQSIRRWGDSGLRELAEMVASPRANTAPMMAALKRLLSSVEQLPLAEQETLLDEVMSAPKILADLDNSASPITKLSPADQRVLALHAVASYVSENKSLIRTLTGTSVVSLKTLYESSQSRNVTGWIHTPSIVVSYTKEAAATGGHNIEAKVTEFRASSSVAKGTVRVTGEEDGRVVLYNPADEYLTKELTPYVAREGKYLSNATLQRGLTAQIPHIVPPAPLPRNTALGFTESYKPSLDRGLQKELTASQTAPIGARTTSSKLLTPAQQEFVTSLQAEKVTGIVVERRSADSILIYSRTSGQMVEATDMSGAVDALSEIAGSERQLGQKPRVFFRNGFSEDQAESMGIVARRNANADLIVEVNPSSAEELGSLVQKDLLDFQATEFSEPKTVLSQESVQGVEFEAKTPFRTGVRNFLWKIRVYFRNLTEPIMTMAGRVKAVVQEVIANCLTRKPSWSMADIGTEVNLELEKRWGEKNVRVIVGQNDDFLITELKMAYEPVG